jgi:RNA polymerase sigma-70 factor, ECF subfamily
MQEDLGKLIQRVGLGDRQAFRVLYSLTSPKLYAVCLRVLREKPDAEDALQEVYIKIWHNAGRFAVTDQSPVSWLAAIARNHAIDRIRARKPQSVAIEDAPEVADEGKDPEQAVLMGDERQRVDNCLGQLKAERAAAVRAAYVEGYSYQELADRFRLPLNTVRTWLRRSLLQLRECLEG